MLRSAADCGYAGSWLRLFATMVDSGKIGLWQWLLRPSDNAAAYYTWSGGSAPQSSSSKLAPVLHVFVVAHLYKYPLPSVVLPSSAFCSMLSSLLTHWSAGAN